MVPKKMVAGANGFLWHTPHCWGKKWVETERYEFAFKVASLLKKNTSLTSIVKYILDLSS